MYDPDRDTYHIFYQSFPQHLNFGNTSWGHATSKDLITWTDVGGWDHRSFVAIEPSNYSVPSYDWLGAFSGGAYATNLNGDQDGNLTLMYSGDVLLPDNWKKPYELGPPYATETQNIATSSDGGITWQKWEGNPWLNGQPGGWNVTGLRDPVFAPNARLDKILGREEGSKWYLVMGSGIREVGPRIPLFSANSHDLTNWTFEGALWEPPINYTWGGDRTKTGNYGANFELAGFFDEVEKVKYGGDGHTTKWIVPFGAEGYNDTWHPLEHWSLFVLGDVHRRANGSAEFEVQASGVLDWGKAYALNQFYDSKNDRRVVWGWSDEDLNNTGLIQQGFQGSLGLPRELYILKSHNVLPPKDGICDGPEIWEASSDNRTYTVTTVAQHPLSEVVEAIHGEEQDLKPSALDLSGRTGFDSINSSHFHLQTTFTPPSAVHNNSYIGVQVRASPNREEYAEIRYYSANSSIVLDRSRSSLITNFIKTTFVGHFEPYTYANGTTEDITMDFFVDGSLPEIFVNDRFAMTSRIYPSRADALGAALVSHDGSNIVRSVKFWEMELNVWPERSLNASSPLVQDAYYETHIEFDNPYLPTGYELYVGN